MQFLKDLFGNVQDVAQNAIPDPRELMDSALQSTSIDETFQQFIETPQEVVQKAVDNFGQEIGL